MKYLTVVFLVLSICLAPAFAAAECLEESVKLKYIGER